MIRNDVARNKVDDNTMKKKEAAKRNFSPLSFASINCLKISSICDHFNKSDRSIGHTQTRNLEENERKE